MQFLNNIYKAIEQSIWVESILYVLGPSAIIVAVILYVFLVLRNEQIKKLQKSLENLQNTYNDLDNQAKLIIKTDLELHKAQGELDKKISGLYTLQKISHILSTTLDENEIFEKISQEHITELGFDKAISFLIDPEKFMSLDNNIDIKLKAGYTEKDIDTIFRNVFIRESFESTIRKAEIISSLDIKIDQKRLDAFIKTAKINSFICAPIAVKEGIIGVLFVGSESSFSPITLGDKDMVSILANQIGQSIENARLFEETWRAQQDLDSKVKQRTRELSEALEEIKIISKRKSDFISAVSHELRTPLTSIKGYASLLSAGKLGEISLPVKERIDKINKHSDDLSQLINNLLDISRIESGRVEMKIESVNLKEMVDSLADLFVPQLKERQIDFIQQLCEEIKIVSADKNQLQRVFINLIGNALKFTPANGKITIRTTHTDDFLQIDVEDTGKGIAEQNLSKIFEEFYREDNEINQNVKGTGLGLSLVKYIVEAHKGRIWVNSKLDQGSTFSFTLPVPRSQ